MRFADDLGNREVLWVEAVEQESYCVLQVPVFIYGISVGTIVRAAAERPGILDFGSIVRESTGGTVRVIVRKGGRAGQWYLDEFLPAAGERDLHVSPATFFDPRMVAIHVRRRSDVVGPVGEYLAALEEQERIQQWERADPPYDMDNEATERMLRGEGVPAPNERDVLEHPLPTSSIEDLLATE